jgi:hypothetical protein
MVRVFSYADCQLPIADFLRAGGFTIGIWQSAIGNLFASIASSNHVNRNPARPEKDS